MNELDKLKDELEDLRQMFCFGLAFLRDLLPLRFQFSCLSSLTRGS